MINKIVLFLILSTFAHLTISAQWSKKKGNGYYKLSAWSLVSDQHYTDTGEIDPNATRGYFNVNFYGEYGITNKLDVITYMPMFTRTYQNEQISGTRGSIIQDGESLNSVGDIDLAIRYGWLKTSNLALSTSLKFGIPTGNSAGGSDGSFQTGDGEFNQLLQVDFGVPFNLITTPGYFKTYVGFNNRTENFSDELHFGGEAGLNFFRNKFWFIGRANIVQSLQNGSLSAQNSQGSIFANNVEFTSLGAEVAYYLTKTFGISFTYATAVSGRIIYASPSYAGGVFLDIK